MYDQMIKRAEHFQKESMEEKNIYQRDAATVKTLSWFKSWSIAEGCNSLEVFIKHPMHNITQQHSTSGLDCLLWPDGISRSPGRYVCCHPHLSPWTASRPARNPVIWCNRMHLHSLFRSHFCLVWLSIHFSFQMTYCRRVSLEKAWGAVKSETVRHISFSSSKWVLV